VRKTIETLVELGQEHRTAIREKVALQNMLKARVREYVGYDALKSGTGESLSRAKMDAVYKKYIDDEVDPVFTNRVRRIIEPYREAKRDQEDLAKRMGHLVSGNRRAGIEPMPIYEWLTDERQRGCGAPMLAKILAEAGRDLCEYSTPAKLWKRFGEHVVDGRAPKRRKGQTLNFSPYRRSVSYFLGASLVKSGGYWKEVYDARKRYEVERAEAGGLIVVPTAKINAKNKDRCMSEGQVHMRAMRYTRKKFLESLWQAWTGISREMNIPEFIRKAA